MRNIEAQLGRFRGNFVPFRAFICTDLRSGFIDALEMVLANAYRRWKFNSAMVGDGSKSSV